MPQLPFRPAGATDRLLAALCLLCVATLLLALVLGDVHRRRQLSLQEMQLLHRDLQHLLERPRLLDVRELVVVQLVLRLRGSRGGEGERSAQRKPRAPAPLRPAPPRPICAPRGP